MTELPIEIVISLGLALMGMLQSLIGVMICAFPTHCGKEIIYTGAAMSVIFGGLATLLILLNSP